MTAIALGVIVILGILATIVCVVLFLSVENEAKDYRHEDIHE